MGYTSWRDVLEEFDHEVETFSRVALQPLAHAKHFNAEEPDPALQNEVFERSFASGKLPDGHIYYPYVEGIGVALGEALAWLKSPPSTLRKGLVSLAEGAIPDNLLEIFALHGEFREKLGVLYAKDTQHAAFTQQRTSGKSASSDYELKRYAASYMIAAMRSQNADIKYGRYALITHAKDIVFNNAPPPKGFSVDDFKKLLSKRPLKPGENPASATDINEKFRKDLTDPKLQEWADELLIFKIQHYDI